MDRILKRHGIIWLSYLKTGKEAPQIPRYSRVKCVSSSNANTYSRSVYKVTVMALSLLLYTTRVKWHPGALTMDMSEPAEQPSALSDPQSFPSHAEVCLHFILFAFKMLSSKIEQHVHFKCLLKLNKTLLER